MHFVQLNQVPKTTACDVMYMCSMPSGDVMRYRPPLLLVSITVEPEFFKASKNCCGFICFPLRAFGNFGYFNCPLVWDTVAKWLLIFASTNAFFLVSEFFKISRRLIVLPLRLV